MARRHRPLFQLQHPRRNRYAPLLSQSPLSAVSACGQNCARFLAPPLQTEPAALGLGLVGGFAAAWEKTVWVGRIKKPGPYRRAKSAPVRETLAPKKSNLLRLGILHAKGLHGHLFHALIRSGPVVPVPLGRHNFVRHFHALDNLSEGGILAVQVGSLFHHDEKLAAGRVGMHCPRHGQHTAVVLQIIGKAVLSKLPLDRVPRVKRPFDPNIIL